MGEGSKEKGTGEGSCLWIFEFAFEIRDRKQGMVESVGWILAADGVMCDGIRVLLWRVERE